MRVVRVAIAGFGGVGRATASLLLSRRARYRQVYGVDIRLVAVCGSRAGLSDNRGLGEDQLGALEDGLSGPAFIEASGADLLIEAGPSDFRTGGPGLGYIRSALSAGHDTIVVSKGALVHSGIELRQLARRSGALLKLSGAAAAALPTIDLVDHSLKGCTVLKVEGILNATTNYLLDAMMTRGIGFDAALREAQLGGFAETDPRNDTEGWDTACKLLILANFGLDADLTMNDLTVEGIQSVSGERIEAWRREGLVPKLVGSLTWADGTFKAAVGIKAYPLADPLANIRGKDKAIRIVTDAMGETIAIGSGKEPLATAAAALKDLEHVLTARAAAHLSE
ncbi:homoserine dehydrogenase (plasmid) [Rhizobium leguminosarum]|uniref:homoserine dehydrogenase n=1 Tax=Rhizobium leguminosarum TaxID=384 RepID=UPI00102F5AB2|nr:homoserine dehydrogenase [Rhizobium leguminosarum]TBF43399.1 homoserine dehydrogenase [Rhizobium leguminosarum]TBF46306.1 homoserine dehydrogenase [Rhizobium leguminosarum]TBF47722.1 homoserine dehydrogenase [Rhizobium leguminosarum]TBF65197.1 homoserine dehydrogenase [Rhizobium leguminosarum]TBF67270.1 homoserine dehydrogenase [Rhizobium leguminosarum]